MVGGGSRVTLDLPPFTLLTERNEVSGINLVGLKRRGASREAMRELKEAFRAVYAKSGNIREIAAAMLSSRRFKTAEGKSFLEFFGDSKRGFARLRQDRTFPRVTDDEIDSQIDAFDETPDESEFDSYPLNAANRALSNTSTR